ncbi:MAG: hypothetical protein JXB38_07055 [Anaerolineales bacterium]|nr:hypothetical protein [Anaerolineales bacterium]
MKKTPTELIQNVLLSVVCGVILNVVTNQLTSASITAVITIIAALLIFLFLTLFPVWESLKNLFDRLKRTPRVKGKATFPQIFDFNHEPVHLVYTCRARIDKIPCPTEYEFPQSPKIVQQHIALDEFYTQAMMAEWYFPQLIGDKRAVTPYRFHCTNQVDVWEEYSKSELRDRSTLPEFMSENLVIIGENSIANIILDEHHRLIDFSKDMIEIAPYRSDEKPKVQINLKFHPRKNNTIEPHAHTQILTSFTEGSQNAVAMLCYLPNPFNLQKNVLILFGCHRVGQYLLEAWLRDPQSERALRKLFRRHNFADQPYGQIVMFSPYKYAAEEQVSFEKIQLVQNTHNKLPFFPIQLSAQAISQNNFKLDQRTKTPQRMVDISLLVSLADNDATLTKSIETFFKQNLPFLDGQYLESNVAEIGLHVTLYEFATHLGDEQNAFANDQYKLLAGVLQDSLKAIPGTTMGITGYEILPTNIILHVDFPRTFISQIQEACQQAVQSVRGNAQNATTPADKLFNINHMPALLHCTAIRYRTEFSEENQEKLRAAAQTSSRHHFGNMDIDQLSLMLVTKQPYQNVQQKDKIDLATK